MRTMTLEKQATKFYANSQELSHRSKMTEYLHSCPIPDDELLTNLGLFIESKNLARILFMDYLFRQIIEVPGVIMEFGTRYGQNTVSYTHLTLPTKRIV